MTTTTDSHLLMDYALEVRAKNAGPFWMTLEAFMRDADGYTVAADPEFLNEQVVSGLYDVPEDQVQIFRIPELNVVKISFPRRIAQGALRDHDLHCGQQHVPLAQMRVPDRLL